MEDDRGVAGVQHDHFRGLDINLGMSVVGRPFIMNTGPVGHSVNGWVLLFFPRIHIGAEMESVEPILYGGKVITAKAKRRENFLLQQLNTDVAALLAEEFGAGLNPAV